MDILTKTSLAETMIFTGFVMEVVNMIAGVDWNEDPLPDAFQVVGAMIRLKY